MGRSCGIQPTTRLQGLSPFTQVRVNVKLRENKTIFKCTHDAMGEPTMLCDVV